MSPIPSGAPGRRDRGRTTPGSGTSRRASGKIAIVLSAYPTKHSRIGNAVGLDTPVSLIRLLRAMREAGYDLGAEPGDDPGHRRRSTRSRARNPTPRPATR